MSEDWITGKNPVIEALKSKRPINKILILESMEQRVQSPIVKLAKQNKVLIQKVPKRKLDQLGEHHQGVVASVAAYTYATIDDLFAKAKKQEEDPFFILLDELEDPRNLGSIMRTADAVGAHGIIIPKRRSVQLTQTVAKASTGAIEYVPVVRVTNMNQTIERLKDEGVWIVGTDAKGEHDYREIDFDMPLALVVGSEGKGISRLVLKNCDWLVNLPMRGSVTSLNASVSASLMMYEVYRNRFPIR
ncbi:23S rRNA (guanosine(2251)-2'-O)-methyltransferase RlmB [Tenuibacillus multivorans]|uniref:23S rRNA (Guanosine2251-2'-O)-methyltransferase n=1 Tax=Tenuibacillus multivorans TaxID=237069 RepID=A0A1H0F3V2_9BACI|nr:23S rRNA (guanosine(2251)-2'-O)-methyltransferase RlmB [Tenuibacillus multivorans]GEL78087.1 23S rRNA (guanosine(2251)-2'-O)-methyltransferase RlmB [Tenuibacillus multivorans]SDN89233.1 23S rRNA (guanosine2251-2'-O)-methyltransferase [Tenuibacillus multivorans]